MLGKKVNVWEKKKILKHPQFVNQFVNWAKFSVLCSWRSYTDKHIAVINKENISVFIIWDAS